MNYKLQLTFLLSMFMLSGVFAQTKDMPWSIGAGIGISEYKGDLGNGFFKFDLESYSYGNNQKSSPGIFYISASRYLDSRFDLAARVFTGEWGYFKDANNYIFRNATGLEVTPRWKFLNKENSRFTPYLMAGLGMRRVKVDYKVYSSTFEDNASWSMAAPIGAGVNVKINEKLGFNVQTNFGFTTENNNLIKEFGGFNSENFYWNHTAGITYNLGKTTDEDNDGVSDKRDKCPGTTKGALVDSKGCIIDRDKDGVADNLDACPDVAGLVAFAGCPDSDGDGVEDAKDKCPTVKGLAKFEGCPDSDGDGIEDAKDKCPKVAGLAKFEGCPDSDGDGIEDSKDDCPNIKGIALFKGCPDTDNDGIPDKLDKCPNVKGPLSNNGCPEVKVEVQKVFDKALTGVQFESAKSTIKKQSFAILDNVVSIMKENTDYKLFIAGHTDSQGNADMNLQLSKERAAAVVKYITDKGVAANRLRSEGYGQTIPVADNATAEGRAKNRRVEFKVEFD